MITGGTEVRIGVTDDRVFGPLVTFGAQGDHAARLTPLTDTDADALIRSVRAAPQAARAARAPATDSGDAAQAAAAGLPARRRPARGHRARPQPGHRQPHGVFAMDARIKVTPCPLQDPFLRRLR